MIKKRVAIFGGSFNPIHNGHIIIINHLIDLFDEVMVMPANVSPHKVGMAPHATGHQRYDMIHLATKTIPNVTVSDFEITRDGPSYTYETIRDLRKANPLLEYELVIGYDQYLAFTQWTKYQKIIDMVEINVISRGDSIITKTADMIFNFITIPAVDISSTQVRKNIKENKPIRELVPNLVGRYIKDNNLYV